MTKTIRYDPVGYDGLSAMMEEHSSGDYVAYEDYEALESDYNVLRRESLLLKKKQQTMMQRLKDIWVEG